MVNIFDDSLANRVRHKILEFAYDSGEGHVASSFSIVEILIEIYYSIVTHEQHVDFRSLVLSKGHAVFALYGLMSQIPELRSHVERKVALEGSSMIGHVPKLPELGLFFGTGSLGHGLPHALGVAFDRLDRGINDRVHVIVGDGEANEGTFWESLNILQKFPELPISIYIDANGSTSRAIPEHGIKQTVIEIWGASECNGHNRSELRSCIATSREKSEASLLWCNTIKGYPLCEIMNSPSWHHKAPTLEEFQQFSNKLLNEK